MIEIEVEFFLNINEESLKNVNLADELIYEETGTFESTKKNKISKKVIVSKRKKNEKCSRFKFRLVGFILVFIYF